MSIRVVLFLWLCLTGAAYANPIIFPSISDVDFVVVLFCASVVEVSILTLLLFCFDLALKPVWLALFAGNLIIYFLLFLPLMDVISSIWMVELIIVAADGILIKIVSLFDAFQLSTFRGLSWKYVFMIAAMGNIVSYYLGVAMQA